MLILLLHLGRAPASRIAQLRAQQQKKGKLPQWGSGAMAGK